MKEQNPISSAYLQAVQFQSRLGTYGLLDASTLLTFGESLRLEGLDIVDSLGYEQEVYFTAFGAAGSVAAGMLVNSIGMAASKFRLMYLKNIGNTWKTPAGLIYGPDATFVNRIKHVLAHLTPDPTKPTHSVFNVAKNELLPLLDDAWLARPATYVVHSTGTWNYILRAAPYGLPLHDGLNGRNNA